MEEGDAASVHSQLTCKPLQDYVNGVLVVEALLHSLSVVDADDDSPGIRATPSLSHDEDDHNQTPTNNVRESPKDCFREPINSTLHHHTNLRSHVVGIGLLRSWHAWTDRLPI